MMLNISLILWSIDYKKTMSFLLVIVVVNLNMSSDLFQEWIQTENLKSVQITVHFTNDQLQ